MTKIKLCGLSRPCDIETANELKPEFIGFVLAPKVVGMSRPKNGRTETAACSDIKAVGVFVKENPETIANLLNSSIIDIAQLHGGEDEDYIRQLREMTNQPIIKAFRIDTASDIADAECSNADYVLLDSGSGGTGTVFDWKLIQNIKRPYFLAGGLGLNNVEKAVKMLKPYAVDVSSGIETNGLKDKVKMAEFVAAVKKEDRI